MWAELCTDGKGGSNEDVYINDTSMCEISTNEQDVKLIENYHDTNFALMTKHTHIKYNQIYICES